MEILHSSNLVFCIVMVMLAGELYARPQPNAEEEMKQALYNLCSGKHPITEEMRTSAIKGILPEDRNFKCLLMCFFDEFGLIDDQGVIDGETILSLKENIRPMYEPIIKSCLPNEAGKPDRCEAAYNFVECGIKLVPKSVEFLPL